MKPRLELPPRRRSAAGNHPRIGVRGHSFRTASGHMTGSASIPHAALTRRFSAPASGSPVPAGEFGRRLPRRYQGRDGLPSSPCALGDLEPDLVRVDALPDDFTLDLWLLAATEVTLDPRPPLPFAMHIQWPRRGWFPWRGPCPQCRMQCHGQPRSGSPEVQV